MGGSDGGGDGGGGLGVPGPLLALLGLGLGLELARHVDRHALRAEQHEGLGHAPG